MELNALLYSCFYILIFSIAFKLFQQRRKNLPPSPLALPIIGHLHLIKEPLHRTLFQLSQKYGSIFSLKFGSINVVIVSSPSAVEECFTKNDIVFANRPKFILGRYLGYNNTTLALAPYGDHWRHLRKLSVVEIFSSSRLSLFQSIREDEVKTLLCRLFKVVSSSNDFTKVELRPFFRELTFNIIMRMVAGKQYYGKNEFRDLIEEIFEHSGASNPADFLPLLKLIDYQGLVKRAKKLSKKADGFLQGLIDEHRNDKQSRNSMISHLLSLQESQPEYYTDEIIKGLVMVMLVAGTDTTSVTLEWALSNLLNHPDVLNKARIELQNKLGADQLMDESDLSTLHYLQNIISESSRLYPSAPLLVPHVSSDDCTIEGYHVPRNTMLMVNAWAIYRDPRWWDDPTSFKPERFENEESVTHKLMPFGLGRRACPAVNLAQRVVALTLGSLIQCFEWTRVDKTEIDMTEGKGLTMPKAVSLEVMCKPYPIMNNIYSQDFSKFETS